MDNTYSFWDIDSRLTLGLCPWTLLVKAMDTWITEALSSLSPLFSHYSLCHGILDESLYNTYWINVKNVRSVRSSWVTKVLWENKSQGKTNNLIIVRYHNELFRVVNVTMTAWANGYDSAAHVKVKVEDTWYSASLWSNVILPITEALGYGSRCQGITQFYLPPTRLCRNEMNYTCFCLSSRLPTPKQWKAALAYLVVMTGYILTHMCRFGLWTYSSDIVDIRESNQVVSLDTSSYSSGCPSVVQSHQSRRNVKYFPCCPEPYADVTYQLELAWRQS